MMVENILLRVKSTRPFDVNGLHNKFKHSNKFYREQKLATKEGNKNHHDMFCYERYFDWHSKDNVPINVAVNKASGGFHENFQTYLSILHLSLTRALTMDFIIYLTSIFAITFKQIKND